MADKCSIVLDDDTSRKVKAYMEQTGLNKSAAIRVVLQTGFRDLSQTVEAAVGKAALKEGIFAGARIVKEALDRSIAEAMSQLDNMDNGG